MEHHPVRLSAGTARCVPLQLARPIPGSALLFSLVTLVAGCGSRGSPPLELIVWSSSENRSVIERQVTEFSRRHAPIRVEVTVLPSAESCRDEFDRRCSQGKAPDICMIASHDLPGWIEKAYLQDLGAHLTDERQFLSQVLGSFRSHERLYAIPCGWSVPALYYNHALFERHGVPVPNGHWEWSDLLAAADSLMVEDPDSGKVVQHGLDLGLSVTLWAPLVWQNHGQLMDTNGTWTLTSPQYLQSNAEAIEFYADLVREYQVAPPPTVTPTHFVRSSRFREGRAAMTIADRSLAGELAGRATFRWDVAPLPRGRTSATSLSTYGYAITSQSARSAEAWKLISFLTSETAQTALLMRGEFIPSLQQLLVSKTFLDFPGGEPIQNKVFAQSLPVSRALPWTTAWPVAEAVLTEEMRNLMTNPRISGRTALGQMQARLDELLLMSRLRDQEPLRTK